MQATSATEIEHRAPISPYPRDASEPLRQLNLTADPGAIVSERRERWSAYLFGAPCPQAPVATKFIAILSGAPPGDTGIAWPATLYPNGFRNQVRDHCALGPGDPDGIVNRIQRRADLAADVGRWSPEDRLRVAQILNSSSLYRATVDVLGPHARSPKHDAHLTYEVARAAYQIGATGNALRAFVSLSDRRCPSLPIRLNAASRLIAHYARSGDDLEECGRWVKSAEAIINDASGFAAAEHATGLGISRVHRAIALYASRIRDAELVLSALQSAAAANDGIAALAQSPLHHLELAQNERLILEAALKAYVATAGRLDAFGAAESAQRLAAIDPWDPYTRLHVGDAFWIHGDDTRALESYDIAVRMGTIVGAHAAHRGATVLARTGRAAEAQGWLARAVELDPVAALAELPGA